MMHDPTNDVRALFSKFSNATITQLDKLPQSGGYRQYFRIHFTPADHKNRTSYIATIGNNIDENKTFLTYTDFFNKQQLPVPEILVVDQTQQMYMQEDLGHTSLFNILMKEGYTDDVYRLYEKALYQLAALQVKGKSLLQSNTPVFNASSILHDLLYFKFYFADVHAIEYDKSKLLQEFEQLAADTAFMLPQYFMYRDFQSRNIMVHNKEIYFIDYQGAMKGHPAYDVASLLYQAKAALPEEWKQKLFQYYLSCFQSNAPVNPAAFTQAYKRMVFIRMLQTLGAYGYRGLFEQKSHFISSITPALKQLSDYLKTYAIHQYPVLQKLLTALTDNTIRQRYQVNKADDASSLVVHINSFSFIKRGYPNELSNNGGGYVFDCRGILNPGRLEEFKTQTGRDKEVITFLETQTRMSAFLENVFKVVDVTVENYLERNFEHLTVNFGCTGGQHRSVYAADALDKHLREKYNVRTVVNHLEQSFNT